ncbi:hypothetical protein NHH03_08440 [Stieleria sp. TO1_6]|uniref:type II secretion system protein N n=1 Tax=Stieleria tagensis TaxID=2956795 RepID=UPI00209ACEB8|nr:type II secretion system protein N [Stieleria tagensis]MCO8121762.1 hypothetical protein [Stieleria tagensis]
MNLTTQRRILAIAAAGCLAMAAGSVVWSLSDLDASGDDSKSGISKDRGASQTTEPGLPTENDSSAPDTDSDNNAPANLSLALQRPLYDPPPPPPKPRVKPPAARPVVTPVAKPPRLEWTLVGTLIQSGRSVAILSDATGKTDIRGAGEQVELSPTGIVVSKVESDQVTLEVNGKPTTLRLQQSFDGRGSESKSGGQARRRNR